MERRARRGRAGPRPPARRGPAAARPRRADAVRRAAVHARRDGAPRGAASTTACTTSSGSATSSSTRSSPASSRSRRPRPTSSPVGWAAPSSACPRARRRSVTARRAPRCGSSGRPARRRSDRRGTGSGGCRPASPRTSRAAPTSTRSRGRADRRRLRPRHPCPPRRRQAPLRPRGRVRRQRRRHVSVRVAGLDPLALAPSRLPDAPSSRAGRWWMPGPGGGGRWIASGGLARFGGGGRLWS